MPINAASGFNAGIAVQMDDPSSRNGTTPHLQFLHELGAHTPALEGLETTCYIITDPRKPFRLFFTRDATVKPITELEAYFALMCVDDGQRFSKVYACGEGVQKSDQMWFLDGVFGDHSTKGIKGTARKNVVLVIHRCRLKDGTKLGVGHLLSADVSWTSQDFVKFTFQYLTNPQHVSDLGLTALLPHPTAIRPVSGAASPSSSTSADVRALEDAPDPANTFLRATNSLLVSLLSPEQKLEFLRALSASPTFTPYLSPGAKAEMQETIARLSSELSAATPRAPPLRTESAPVSISPTAKEGASSHLMFGSLSYTRTTGDTLDSPVEAAREGEWLTVRRPPISAIRSPERPSVREGSLLRKSPLGESFVQVQAPVSSEEDEGVEKPRAGEMAEQQQKEN